MTANLIATLDRFGEDLTIKLEIETVHASQISENDQRIIDLVDHLAFAEHFDEDTTIKWSSSDWMVLGRLDGIIVSQLCLLKREIRVGEIPVMVGGVGGVGTLPAWRHHGFATEVMRAASRFMKNELQVLFGLLVCAETTQPFYAQLGWKAAATEIWFEKDGSDALMRTVVMILPLANADWPAGEINLNGLPW